MACRLLRLSQCLYFICGVVDAARGLSAHFSILHSGRVNTIFWGEERKKKIVVEKAN